MSRYLAFIEQNFDIHRMTGDEACTLCPYHNDRRPSMYINTATGLWLCHSCGAKGNIEALAEHLGVTLLDQGVPVHALRRRLERCKVVSLKELAEPPKRVREGDLENYRFDHPYWTQKRGFTPDIIKKFDLGWDPNRDMLTIPIRDSVGRLKGIIYRKLDDSKPKYLYPTGFPIGKALYGSWMVRKSDHRKVALVEGAPDAIACWDARVPALALLGARLTKDQRKLLLSLGIRTVVIMTDNDRAGRAAVGQIKKALYKSGITVAVGQYRSFWTAKDPGELTVIQRRKIFHSAEDDRAAIK
jgi:DNA primase